ncbi:unnamed protein product [Anisakis simplex]|uniref:BHLH domain-containing protein n=1 Tax=Anisakis simplex TaxID=6269 RepID=A0A0M3JXL9_ANISI|nr:unnamed protein product [Anisakis simplex]
MLQQGGRGQQHGLVVIASERTLGGTVSYDRMYSRRNLDKMIVVAALCKDCAVSLSYEMSVMKTNRVKATKKRSSRSAQVLKQKPASRRCADTNASTISSQHSARETTSRKQTLPLSGEENAELEALARLLPLPYRLLNNDPYLVLKTAISYIDQLKATVIARVRSGSLPQEALTKVFQPQEPIPKNQQQVDSTCQQTERPYQ